MAIKISKIQQRLAQAAYLRSPAKFNQAAVAKIRNQAAEELYDPVPAPVAAEPQGPLVLFMSAADAGEYNLEGAAVLSLVGAYLDTTKARDYRQTRFEVGEITPKAITAIHDFVQDNIDCDKFIVHCTYGEQRSRAVAHYIKRVVDHHRKTRELGLYRFDSGRYRSDMDNLAYGDLSTYKFLVRHWRDKQAAVPAWFVFNSWIELVWAQTKSRLSVCRIA